MALASAANAPPTLQYRPDVDGLRAVAVLSVVAYHAFPQSVRGGFVGVDVFFVISGYLISGIILGDLRRGRFSFGHFYARRIRRIFPALTLVLAACFGLGWFTLLPREYEQLGKHIAGGAGFISNFVFWKESGYFDQAAELKPLLHLWSLGIEEQFYLVWPLLLYVAWKLRVNFLALALPVLVVSFFLNVHTVQSDVVAAFYSPITRFWELMLGSTLAYASLFQKSSFNARILPRAAGLFRDLAPFAGIGLIVTSVFALSTNKAFPGWWAVLPTAGAFLLISAGPDAWFNRRMMSNRALVGVGLVSYPLYLWHWPFLSYLRILGPEAPSPGMRIGAVLISLVFAWLTYKLVETPMRYGDYASAKVLCLALLMLTMGCIGFGTFEKRGLRLRMRARENQILQKYATSLDYDLWKGGRYRGCWLTIQDGGDKYSDECVDRGKSGPLVFVWGDSHASRLLLGLRRTIGDQAVLAQYTRDACPPILDFGYENCVSGNRFILDKIREAKPATLILFAVWNRYGQFGKWDETPAKQLDRTLSELKALGIPQIIVIGPPPQWKKDLPRAIVEFSKQDVPLHRVPQRMNFESDIAARRVGDSLEKLFQSRKDVTFISAWKAFCDANGCLTRLNEEADGITTVDYGHLSLRGAEYLARMLPITALSDLQRGKSQ